MWLYADHIEVRKDFIPVFSAEADREQPATWKFFIPHRGMQAILEGLIRALERGSPADRLALWVHGAYGTGKTFVAFVLKHLLEDDLDEVEDYFRKHPRLQDLWLRLKALRKRGNYVVVYRSGSGHLTSTLKLLVEIQEAIKDSLRQKGYTKVAGETLQEAILQKLADSRSTFDWPKAFAGHRGRFLDFASPEEVVAKLQAGDVSLTERVARVLEEEGFAVMDNPQAVKGWIKEVIQQNDLAGIIFMWDEFTDFFIHNAAVTSLQELAHATAEFPFYLFLITHRSPEHFQRLDEQTRKKLLERFHNLHLEMAPVTAYQLMANAIDVKKEAKEQWETRKESLWSRVEKSIVHLLGDEGRKDDFKGLIPMHPYAAFLLATITRQFSSSQRTLFRFLKEEDEYSFSRFLKNYPQNEWFLFTADALWDYFFRDDNPELTERIRDIIGYYRSRCEQIEDEEEQRVFKVLMLLIALWRQMPEGSKLLRPLRANLEVAFTATPVAEKLSEIVQKLRVKGLIHSLFSGSEEEFTLPLVSIDERKLEDLKKQIQVTFSFERVIGNNGEIGSELLKIFGLRGAASRRQVLNIVSVKDLKFKRERVQPDLKPYQIGNVLVIAQNEEQLAEAEALSAALAKKTERTAYLVIQAPFGIKRWEDWINYKAHQRYCVDMHDMENAKFYSQQLDGLVKKWLSIVKLVKHKAYFGEQEIEVVDQAGYEKYFQMLTEKIYPSGPEQISIINTLYDIRFGKVGAEVGLGIKTSSEPYTSLVNELKKQGFWSGDGFQKKPEHPLSRAKQEIDNFFAQQENVNLSELWRRMQVRWTPLSRHDF